jgi:hypothetical protein
MSEENQPKNTGEGEKPGPNSQADKAANGWEMPAPIFRVSEGVTVSKRAGEKPVEKEAQLVHEPLPDSPPDIQPEPETVKPPAAEELVLEPVPDKKPVNVVLSFIMTAAGIVGMILFLIVLFGLAYFYFVYRAQLGASE